MDSQPLATLVALEKNKSCPGQYSAAKDGENHGWPEPAWNSIRRVILVRLLEGCHEYDQDVGTDNKPDETMSADSVAEQQCLGGPRRSFEMFVLPLLCLELQ